MAIGDPLIDIGGKIKSDITGGKSPPKPSQAELQCKANGGTWDAVNQTCIMPEPKPETLDPNRPLVDVTPSGTNLDLPKGGTPIPGATGGKELFVDSRGESYFLTPEEFAQTQGGQAGATQGTQPGGFTSQADIVQQQKLQGAISQIGQVGTLTAAEEADINLSQAFAAGAARVAPAAAGGAAVGAAAGLVGSGGALSVPGAIALGGAGAVGGFISGVLGNIKEQQRGELSAAKEELAAARTNMRQLAMFATQDPANADVYVAQYNVQLTRLHQARRQTKAEVTGDLNAFMEDGREQLADFDVFLQPGGTADIYGQKLAVALSSGVPLSFNGEELFLEGEQ